MISRTRGSGISRLLRHVKASAYHSGCEVSLVYLPGVERPRAASIRSRIIYQGAVVPQSILTLPTKTKNMKKYYKKDTNVEIYNNLNCAPDTRSTQSSSIHHHTFDQNIFRGMFLFKSGLRFSFRALEVPELSVKNGLFYILKWPFPHYLFIYFQRPKRKSKTTSEYKHTPN